MSIYDFATTSADSIKDTDFSTNYGFNVVPNATGIPYDEHFARGLYHYANIGKDDDQLRLAQKAFGKNMLDKKHAPYWIGEAATRELGCTDITQAYIAYDIPIPEGVTDSRQLSTTLGQGILDKFSKQYDTAKAAREKSANRAANNQRKLIDGTIKPADLDPEQTQELIDIYGYHPADAYAAGQIIRSRDKKDIISQVWEPTKAALAGIASVPSRVFESAAYAFKGDITEAIKRLSKSSSGFDKDYYEAVEGTISAYANNLASDAKFLQLAQNPNKALQIAQHHFYQKEKALLDNATAVGRAVLKTHDILQDTYQGAGDILAAAGGAVDSMLGNNDYDPRQAQRVSAAIAEGKTAARAEVQESRGWAGVPEKAFDAIAETARFGNPYTAVPAVASLFRDCAGRSFNAIADDDGSVPSDSNLEVYGKAAANAAINYGSRNVATKLMPKVMARGLAKAGVHSSAARYIANAGWTSAGFAFTLPLMDAGLRAAYDAVAVSHPKLKDGIRDLENWWNKDLRDPQYWGTQVIVGSLFGAVGQRNYHRAGKFLAEKAEMSGLSAEEADSIRRSTILEDQAEAYQKAISDNLQNKPQETVDTAIANTRKAVEEQQQRMVEEQGYNAQKDNAQMASLRFFGLSLAEGKDSDHVTMLIGGHIDPGTGKYIEGTKSVSLTKQDAAFYIGNLLDARTASRSTAIREMMGRSLFIDAANKYLQGKIEIRYILSPLDINQIIQQGTEAQAKIDQITKDLIEKSKGEDGTPSLSEADARAQAAQTMDGDHSLAEIAAFGKEAQSRLTQEQNKQLSQDPDKSFISNAYVVTKGKRSDSSLRRIFKIAWGATTRNMMEEYSEQWMSDYFFETGADYTDLWRLLSDLSTHLNIPNFTLSTLRNSNPALAERLDKGLTTQDITDAAELDAIRRDVTEGLSVLLMADIGKISADGHLPEWTQELFSSKFLTDKLMEQEMTLAAALHAARAMGAEKPAMLRLLDLNANEAMRIISSVETPTTDQFFDTYVKTVKDYKELEGNPHGLSADAIEAAMAQHAKDAEALNKQIKDTDDERNAAAIEAVKEAESLPENKDKSHEQIVEEVNERIISQKEEDIAERPTAVADSSSSNGKSVVTFDDSSLLCHMAMVNIADLTMMPNFKSGSDKDSGEVHALTGDYHPDHDPIRILRRTDGTLMVISGRHRLAHAKRFGAKKIAAYIYDETPEHDLNWARLKDIEWNIKDNQATPQDVALLIRGELIDGIPPLDDASILRMGITRKGSQALIGYNIGKNATPALIEAWRNDPDTFTTDTVKRIAMFAPNNPLVQRAAIKAAAEGVSGKNLLTLMGMEQDRINYLKASGIAIQLDLFNEADFDTTYNDFVNSYALNKVNKLNLRAAALRTADKVANDADFAEAVQGSGLRIDNALRKRYQNRKNKPMSPQEELMLWRNPWTNMDVIGDEINNAFAKEHPEEWQKMQDRKAEQAAAQAALDTTPADDTPDLGNSVQGDVSDIPSWNFSLQARTGQEKFARTNTNGEPSLPIILQASNTDGTNATKNSLVTSLDGSAIWGHLPDLPVLRDAGLAPGPIIMRYGNDKTGFMHVVLKHGQWIMDATGIDNPIEAATRFIESVLEHVEKLHKDSKPNAAILKNGEKERYYIVTIGADAIDKSFYKIKTAFVAEHENRFDYMPNLIDEDGSLKLRIPVSSLGESQRLRGQSEHKDLNPKQPVTAEPSSTPKLPQGSKVVKDISYSANQTSHNFSAVDKNSLAAWQQDPTLGLGMLGSFENNILNKFAPSHDDLVDARLVSMINNATRRMRELQHVYDKDSTESIMGEMTALINEYNAALPAGYRFGLEGYKMFTATYANLRKYGNPDSAAANLPMAQWPEIMAKSFRKTFERLLKGKLTEQEENSFFNRYGTELIGVDLDAIRKDLNSTRRKYLKEATRQFPKEAKHTDAYKAAVAAAREQAYDAVRTRHEAEFAKAYEAIATMRADRLMDKFLTRIIHQLNRYRKDRVGNKIDRALASLTPIKQKKGKPVKGTVSMEVYNTVLDNYRLMRLTKAQKESFEEAYPKLADMEADEILHVPTFDHEGNEITLKVTKQQYETYASFESMSADAANDAAKALGTLIAAGKEAWQLKAEAERAQIKDFCSPIYENHPLTGDEDAKGRRQKLSSIITKDNKFTGLASSFPGPGLLNDSSLFDLISSVPGLQQFKKIQERIADANAYKETAESEKLKSTTLAIFKAIGYNNVDLLNTTSEQDKAYAAFLDKINEKISLENNPLVLTIQPPDFEKQQRDIFRTRFLRRLRSITDKKNYNPHELAAALEQVKPHIPADIYNEAMEKYGKDGDSSLYEGKPETALINTFPLEKFGSLINLEKSIKETAAEKLNKWHKENPVTSESFTEITRDEAAYKVLMTEQPDLADNLRRQGYTPEVIQRLKNIAGKEMMNLAYSLREQLNSRMPQLKKIYEATYGTPFPAVENYFRAFFDVSVKETTAAQQGEGVFGLGDKDIHSLQLFHTRIKHNRKLDPVMSVTKAFDLAMKQQTNIIAYSDPSTGRHLGEFLNRVLADKKGGISMESTLNHAISSPFTAALKKQVGNMYRIYGENEAYDSSANRLVRDLSASQAFSILSWRATSLVKNSLAFFNTLGGSEKTNPWDWIKSIPSLLSSKAAITSKEMAEQSFIRDRFKGMDAEYYMDATLQTAGVKTANKGKAVKLALHGLSIFGKWDRWFTTRSATIQFNAVYNKLHKENPDLPDAVLREEAFNATKTSLGVKGQPLSFTQRPLKSTQNSWLTAGYFFLGGEAFSTLQDCYRLLLRTEFKNLISKDSAKRKAAWNNLSNFAAVWAINGFAYSLMNLAIAAVLDDEESWRKRSISGSLFWGTLTGPINGIPIISSVLKEVPRWFGSNHYITTPSYLPMSDIGRIAREVSTIWDSDSSSWDKLIGINNAARTLCAAFLATSQRPTTSTGVALKATGLVGSAVTNILDPALRFLRAADERWITPIPEKKKKVKKTQKSTSPKKRAEQKHADDLLNF